MSANFPPLRRTPGPVVPVPTPPAMSQLITVTNDTPGFSTVEVVFMGSSIAPVLDLTGLIDVTIGHAVVLFDYVDQTALGLSHATGHGSLLVLVPTAFAGRIVVDARNVQFGVALCATDALPATIGPFGPGSMAQGSVLEHVRVDREVSYLYGAGFYATTNDFGAHIANLNSPLSYYGGEVFNLSHRVYALEQAL